MAVADLPKTPKNLFFGICSDCSIFVVELHQIGVYMPDEEEKTWENNEEYLINGCFQFVQCPECKDKFYARKLHSRWFVWKVEQKFQVHK